MWDLRGVAARPVFDGFFWFWVARAFLGFWSCAWAGLRGVTARALFWVWVVWRLVRFSGLPVLGRCVCGM